jgi:hypothetical protein
VEVHRPDKDDVRKEAELFKHPLFRNQLAPIGEMIAALRAAQGPKEYEALHRQLVGRFLGAEEFVKKAKGEKAGVKEEIRALAVSGAPKESRRALSVRINELDADLYCARAILSHYRTIGDAIVWALLGYRRDLIAVLGAGVRVGHLAAGAGLDAELSAVDRLWREDGIVAVHADITNCVRHGDLLAVESWEPREFGVAEIKAGGAPDPTSVQMRRIELFEELVRQGYHREGNEGEPLLLRGCPVPFRTHLATLDEALERAVVETHVAFSPEPGLLIEVYDQANPAGVDPELVEERRAKRLAGLDWSDERSQSYSISARILRDRIQSFASLAPLSLLPVELRKLAELLLGRFDVVTSLDPDVLETRLKEAGLNGAVSRGGETGNYFIVIDEGELRFTVPAPAREQILIELMTIETLVETAAWNVEQAKKRGTHRASVALTHTDEADTWGGR